MKQMWGWGTIPSSLTVWQGIVAIHAAHRQEIAEYIIGSQGADECPTMTSL